MFVQSNSLNEAISAIDGTPKSLEDVSYSRFEGRSRNRPTPAVNKRRVFFFIVDALRLDFMVQQDDVISSESPYNRMVNMHRLLRYNASQCTLFGFRAEPPTVTSQRLKSLTTGSLPTFIDIGANMNSSAIIDDNFIDQLLNRHRNSNRGGDGSGGGGSGGDGCSGGDGDVADGVPSRLVVLGDDTWGSLFPAQFTTKHLYDSFNTRDLDTVDNGIISHLFDYLNPMEHKTDTAGKEGKNSTEWDLMIAHFLGVDHIGHTHHAFHPLMYDRLALMDALLQKVVEALPPDAVLFLFGDHGMTDEGEHGGASRAETDSGLFVYSKEPIFQLFAPATADHVCPPGNRVDNAERIDNITAATSEKEHVPVDYDNYTMPYWNDRFGFQNTAVHTVRRHPRTLPQTDFTPTVSLLLGLPIPASSLGMLIPELFQSSCQPPAYQPSSYQQQQQQQNRVSDNNNAVQQNKGDVEICLSADSCSSTSCSATCCSEANSESIYPAAGQDCGNGFSVAEDALMEMLFTNAMQVQYSTAVKVKWLDLFQWKKW